MAQVWEKSYPPGVRWDTPLPPAVPLESLLETTSRKGRTIPPSISTIEPSLSVSYTILQREPPKGFKRWAWGLTCRSDCTCQIHPIS